MLKILPVEKIREADAFTIKNEPIASVDLMERAAKQCFQWFMERNPHDKTAIIFCGPGNNGGDGLALSRMLARVGINTTTVVLRSSSIGSHDFTENLRRLQETPGSNLIECDSSDKLPHILPDNLVVDAIFGSGLTKPITGIFASAVEHINKSGAVVISIDIPSGLFADSIPKSSKEAIIKADSTLTFQMPKLSFLFSESEVYTGRWIVLPIGLHNDFISSAQTRYSMIEADDIRQILKYRSKYAHKGHFGHALLVAGSYGKMGAALLASRACIRSGAGLLTVRIPASGYDILQTGCPEAMVTTAEHQHVISGQINHGQNNAIAIGPGIGTASETATALKLLIQSAKNPLILDADALNILSENKTWIRFLPPGCILTPHPREFERLTKKCSDSFEQHLIQIEFSVRHKVYVILKGAYTSITTPDGSCMFNSTGNPGMATGGSGDVLTGILLGLNARGYGPFQTCIAGVFLHGMAGDLAAAEKGEESLVAGDIIDYLPKAFLKLYDATA